MTNLSFDRQIDEYMVYCRSKQLREKTMASYEQTLRLFERWCKEQMGIESVDKVTESVVRRYINDLQSRGKYSFYADESAKEVNYPERRRDYRQPVSTVTINNYIRNLSAFFNWLDNDYLLKKNPMKKVRQIKVNRTAKEYISDNECLSVCPANVSFIQNENVYELIRAKLSKGEKGVYFKNHTPNIQSILKGIKADASEVALSFSKEKKREELEKNDPQSHALMVTTEKMLREECMLPEDIKLFVSTSRNKEGINIKNKDFSYMIVEAHNQSDVVQMAGRVRYGIDELYIVLDAKQFELTSWKLESNFAATEIAFKDTATKEYSGAANDYFKAICRKSGLSVFNNKQAGDNVYTHKELKAYIEYIEKTFDFVRFNFFRNVFELYDLRVSGYKYLDNSKKAFERAAEEDNPYYELVSQWFPSAKVHPLIPKEKQAEQVFEEFIKKYGVTRIPESEVDELRQQLNITLNTKYKSMNSLLKRFTTKKLERMSRGKNKSKYHKYKLEVE